MDLMLVMAVLGLAAILLAIAVEAFKSRGMRARRRLREAYARYCESIDAEARHRARCVLSACWKGPEARQ